MSLLLIGAAAFLLFAIFSGNMRIIKGIRRFLGTIALLWGLFALYRAFATGTQADPGMHDLIFLWPACLYGFGWFLTIIAYGFAPKPAKGRVVQRQDGAVFVEAPRRFWH